MAYDIKNLSFSLIASSSYAAKQYRACKASTVADYFTIGATTAPIFPVGILQNNPLTGEAGEIWLPGCISKVTCGTALTPGMRVHFANNGLAYSTASVPAGAALYGPVLLAGASSGDVATMSFTPIGIST